jgi:nitric oxide reductase large subunit
MTNLFVYWLCGAVMAAGFICLAEFTGSLFSQNPQPVLLVAAIVAAVLSTKTVQVFSKGASKGARK